MPLQKLQFRPGTNRESTTLANEGGWFESDKVRWRSGFPEKIGGWTKDTGTTDSTLQPPAGSFWGVCRSLFNWITLSGFNLLGVGTNLKYYIQNGVGGYFYDITPQTGTPPGTAIVVASNAFTTTASSSGTNRYVTVTCNVAGYAGQTNDFVTISGVASAVNGIPAANLNAEFQITYVNSSSFTIEVYVDSTVTVTAGTTGAANFTMQINTGADVFTNGVGWGAGGWGGATAGYTSTGWGSPSSAGLGVGIQLRLWSEANFGQNLIINPRGGALYYWVVDQTPTVFNRAQLLASTNTNTQNSVAYWQTDTSCPSVCNYVLVSDASRFVIAFGVNDYGSSTQDPLLIRWSDQESVTTWAPAVTNQAGSYRLSQGSYIVTALQTRQEILVWTDAALYSMQYTGAPYVWGFQFMGANLSIAGPNVAVTANNVTYWMGTDKFYMYTGRVETLPCTLRQYIFDDINMDQAFQFFGGTNEGYNEVWWFYCSISGTDGSGTVDNPNTTIDRYVIFNHLEKTWYYGTMERTAWEDSPLREFPMAAGYNGQLIYHEDGVDDGTTTPPSAIEAYCQSSDFDIGDGHNFGLVWRIIPDVTFDGSTVNNPSVAFTVRPRQNPGAAYGSTDNPTVASTQNYTNQQTYNVQEFTQYAYVRIRGRQMAFKISSSDLGVSWQLGTPRLDVRADGRR